MIFEIQAQKTPEMSRKGYHIAILKTKVDIRRNNNFMEITPDSKTELAVKREKIRVYFANFAYVITERDIDYICGVFGEPTKDEEAEIDRLADDFEKRMGNFIYQMIKIAMKTARKHYQQSKQFKQQFTYKLTHMKIWEIMKGMFYKMLAFIGLASAMAQPNYPAQPNLQHGGLPYKGGRTKTRRIISEGIRLEKRHWKKRKAAKRRGNYSRMINHRINRGLNKMAA